MKRLFFASRRASASIIRAYTDYQLQGSAFIRTMIRMRFESPIMNAAQRHSFFNMSNAFFTWARSRYSCANVSRSPSTAENRQLRAQLK